MGFSSKRFARIAVFILACWIVWIPAKAHAAKLYVVYASISVYRLLELTALTMGKNPDRYGRWSFYRQLQSQQSNA